MYATISCILYLLSCRPFLSVFGLLDLFFGSLFVRILVAAGLLAVSLEFEGIKLASELDELAVDDSRRRQGSATM